MNSPITLIPARNHRTQENPLDNRYGRERIESNQGAKVKCQKNRRGLCGSGLLVHNNTEAAGYFFHGNVSRPGRLMRAAQAGLSVTGVLKSRLTPIRPAAAIETVAIQDGEYAQNTLALIRDPTATIIY